MEPARVQLWQEQYSMKMMLHKATAAALASDKVRYIVLGVARKALFH